MTLTAPRLACSVVSKALDSPLTGREMSTKEVEGAGGSVFKKKGTKTVPEEREPS